VFIKKTKKEIGAMKDEQLPRKRRGFAFGAFVLMVLLTFCVLLYISVYLSTDGVTRERVIVIEEPELSIVEPDENETENQVVRQISVVGVRSETAYAGADVDGLEVIKRTCLVNSDEKFGSGFLLRSNLLVTAAHVITKKVINDWVTLLCQTENDGVTLEVSGSIVAIEPTFDVAFVSIPNDQIAELPPLRLQTNLPEANDQLHMFGYEYLAQHDSCLELEGVHRPTSIIPNLTMNAEFIPLQTAFIAGSARRGNSGGPVFTNDGSIVGMLILTHPAFNRSVMVPACAIEDLLQSHNLRP
jgi:S1-C subfamily serine protease